MEGSPLCPLPEIQVHGYTAIVYSNYVYEIEQRGQRTTNSGRVTEVLVQRNGAWVNPSWHVDSTKAAIQLTQVGAVGSTWWGGRPRPRGGPRLRFRQRDEGVPSGPGGPPHQAAARAIT